MHDRVYGLGYNSAGELGLGHNRPIDTPEEVEELMALNCDHFIFRWGRNQSTSFTNTYTYNKPHKILLCNSRDIRIEKLLCYNYSTLVLTSDGRYSGGKAGTTMWAEIGDSETPITPQLLQMIKVNNLLFDDLAPLRYGTNPIIIGISGKKKRIEG
ncbi:unnamed protein product [Medioppia subpectinata]|uniref:Uncharacterized protein n=1 Tax=Medioppia subpectinata TaxID=1979941 RepID=A0A7R9KVJ4_9ACAR|nr:unnamed protein product [Medioppia subpectinata]CAG2110508.1 unnamed protein product [Medioppia subpectinata]